MDTLKRKLKILPALYGIFFSLFWIIWYMSFSKNEIYKNFELLFFALMMISWAIWAFCFCAIFYYLGKVAEELDENKILWQIGIAIIPALGPIVVPMFAIKRLNEVKHVSQDLC